MIRSTVFILVIILILSPLYAQDSEWNKFYPLSLAPYKSPDLDGQIPPEIIASLDNIRVNSDNSYELQNEEMVCINPTDITNAVAVWRDFRLGYRRIGVGYTFDSGQSWTDALIIPYPPYARQSDPVLWVDRNGTFFLSGLDLYAGDGPSGISVYRSLDGGITWSDPVWAVQEQSEYFEDKQWFGMDQTGGPGDGNIYCVWDRFAANYSATGIFCVASYDSGYTFSEPVNVSVYGPDYVQWPTVTSGPQSQVYVAWYDHRFPRRISMAISYDFGQSFDPEFSVTYLDSAYSNLHGGITSFPFAAMQCDVNPESDYYGRLYIIYADGPADWDIWCIYTDDGGLNWSEKVRVNDDQIYNGCDQFHPWISVDNSGVIHTCFLDRRNDPSNNLLYDLYYTRSIDGGLTWEANHRISTVSSDPTYASLAGLLGEYIGISAWDDEVQMVWTDVRNLNQDAYSARVPAQFLPGDVNHNGEVLSSDVDFLLRFIREEEGLVPDPPIWRADANGDCAVDRADITYLVAYLRGTGQPPVDADCR
jgi:hypothetical protein